MAKLMAPNVRIDWFYENQFTDVKNPTVPELNRGTNLSCAVVTGFTLDFTDSETETTTSIFDDFVSEEVSVSSYEANLQFFLAPRGSSAENEQAYRDAEDLFLNDYSIKGFFTKRIGSHSSKPYTEDDKLSTTYYKVQADLPKITTEEGSPILLEVKFLPLGEAGFFKSNITSNYLYPANDLFPQNDLFPGVIQ